MLMTPPPPVVVIGMNGSIPFGIGLLICASKIYKILRYPMWVFVSAVNSFKVDRTITICVPNTSEIVSGTKIKTLRDGK